MKSFIDIERTFSRQPPRLGVLLQRVRRAVPGTSELRDAGDIESRSTGRGGHWVRVTPR